MVVPLSRRVAVVSQQRERELDAEVRDRIAVAALTLEESY